MQHTKKRSKKKGRVKEQTLQEHFQLKDNLVRTKRKDLLGELLLESDIVHVVLAHLSAPELLLCSMTCRTLLKRIDASKDSAFNQHLRWWYSHHDLWRKESQVLKPSEDGSAYKSTVQLEYFDVQYLWLLNMVPIRGARVQMRMQLHLSLDAVELSGEAKDLDHLRKVGHVSMDVVEWEVLKVTRKETPSSPSSPRFRHVRSGVLGEVRMRVINYVHLFRPVHLIVNKPVIFTFQNVPITDDPMSYRELYVIKCVYNCMHCHERLRRWVSVDAAQPEHRALCSLCLDHLFVEEKHLEKKFKCYLTRACWNPQQKIFEKPPVFATLQNMRVHFVECMYGASTCTISKTPKVMMLKGDVASFNGYASWTHFLACNHKSRKEIAKKSTITSKFRPSISWW
jgi:hypothetical protein